MSDIYPRYIRRIRTLHDVPAARYAYYLKGRRLAEGCLLREVVIRGTPPVLLSLLSRGANPNARDEQGATPLFYAANYGGLAMLRLLLRFGADPNLRENDGYPPIVNNSSATITKTLLSHGADPNISADSGTTALMEAAWLGTFGSVVALIEFGADVNAVSEDGDTPLLEAATVFDGDEETRIRIADYLLRHGANLHHRNESGKTPLIWAAYRNAPAMVSFLLTQGANVDDRDNEGNTAWLWAKRWNHQRVLAVLAAAYAKETKML